MKNRKTKSNVNGAVSRIVITLVLLLIPLIVAPRDALCAPGDEMAQNGLVMDALGPQPAAWTTSAYFPGPAGASFSWKRGVDAPGVLQITNFKDNDSRWQQTVAVLPGTWYRASGSIKTANVSPGGDGAEISVIENGLSAGVHGTSTWQPVEVWIRTAANQRTATLACRLGGFAGLSSGTAYFTAISMTQVGGPPAGAQHVWGGNAPPAPVDEQAPLSAVPMRSRLIILMLLIAGFVILGLGAVIMRLVGKLPK